MWIHLSSTTRSLLVAGILFACSPVWAQDGEVSDDTADAEALGVDPEASFVGQLVHDEDEETDAGRMPSVNLNGYKADEAIDPEIEETRSGSDHVDRDTGELSGGAYGCATWPSAPHWLFVVLIALPLTRRKR